MKFSELDAQPDRRMISKYIDQIAINGMNPVFFCFGDTCPSVNTSQQSSEKNVSKKISSPVDLGRIDRVYFADVHKKL